MESSNESFVWSDASSGNADSDDSSITDTMKNKHNESESEKQYKKKLHKKLFKTESEIKDELLNSDGVKHEAGRDTPVPPSAPSASPQKRKLDRSSSHDETAPNNLDSSVKQEHNVTSDSYDQPPKKKKSKKKKERRESSGMSIEDKFSAEETVVETRPERNTSISMDVESYNGPIENSSKRKHNHSSGPDTKPATEYLDAHVKQENHITSDSHDETPKKKKSKKKKERRESSEMSIEDNFSAEETIVETRPERNTSISMDVESYNGPIENSSKRKHNHSSGPDTKPATEYLDAHVKQEHHIISDSHDETPKKKKSKKKKERRESSEMIIEDKFTAEETVVETRPERNTSISIENYDEPIENSSKKDKKKKKKKRHDSVKQDSENDCSMVDSTYNVATSDILTQDTHDNDLIENDLDIRENGINDTSKNKKLNTSTNKKTKVSDRIIFEDGEDVIAACNDAIESKAQSSKLKRFLKANPHLQLLKDISNNDDPVISQDDEIWLLNCPHEMNINSLKNTSLSLDEKCKIKIDSQTFIGNLECDVNRAAILTLEHNRPTIKSLIINGIINFRKRIPKAHYLDDNIISNNQTDFISLPDTKCRHPLFGPNYKKAIKISAAVRSRLENPPMEPLSDPNEGKKKKKRKHGEIEMSEDVVDGGDECEDRREHKRRRRSERDPDQPVKKKAKRIKQEQESAETWDSEKAIEENLFNF